LLFGLRADQLEQRKAKSIRNIFDGGTVPEPRNRGVHRAVNLFERVLFVRAMLKRDLERSPDTLLIE
jgi:hypothetical protein